MTTHYFMQAFRSLKNLRIYSILGISGFAIGLAVFISIVLLVDHEFRMDTIYDHHERIFRIVGSSDRNADLDYEIFPILKEKYSEVELACPVRQKDKWPFLFKSKNDFIETESFISTTDDFFELFSIEILQSSGPKPFVDNRSIIVTQSTARKLFGDKDPIGQIINLSGFGDFTVSSLIADLPESSSFKAGFILNANEPGLRFGRALKNDKMINPINHFIKLKNGVDVDGFSNRLNQTLHTYSSMVDSVYLQPISSVYMTPGITGNYNKAGNPKLIYLLIVIAALILCLSLINYIHFIVAVQRPKQKITGIRFVHGAGIHHIVAYYLSEAVISLSIALILALILAKGMLPLVNSLFFCTLDFSSLFSWHIFTFLIVTLFMIVLVVSLVSAWVATRTEISSLWSKQPLNNQRVTNKGILTVIQLSVSIVLIACVIGINRQLSLVRETSLGFHSEHLLRLNLPPEFKQYEVLKNRIKECAFVENCSWSNGSPGYINVEIMSTEVQVHGIGADKDFLKTMKIKIIEGRDFLNSDLEKGCFINQATLKYLNFKNLDELKSKTETGLPYNIIGVVSDFNIASFHSTIEPVCIFLTNEDLSFLNVRLTVGNVPEQMESLKQIWTQLMPDAPFRFTFYEEYFDSLYQTEDRQGKAIALFSVIALVITCLGLWGQIINKSLSRTKEIGVRKVNGAKVSEILVMLNCDFVKWVAIAFVIATPIAYYAMHKWLENFAYKTDLRWWIFALAGSLALGIVLLTVSWQSWKAATRNPVEALRYE